MRKLMIAMMIVMLAGSVAMAGSAKDNCGCGLGYVALKDANTDSVLMQLVVTFLNGICGNQTFGITSGTLGCDKPSTVVKNEIMDTYIADNMDDLAVDIASGEGETLDTLFEISGLPMEKKGTFFLTLQSRFDTIFASDDISNNAVSTKINEIIATI